MSWHGRAASSRIGTELITQRPGLQADPRIGTARQVSGGGRGLHGGGRAFVSRAITGTPFESERTRDFNVMADVHPMTATMPLERAAEAYAQMKSGGVKFSMVLTMGH